MALFRNKEIKRLYAVLVIICALLTAGGFITGIAVGSLVAEAEDDESLMNLRDVVGDTGGGNYFMGVMMRAFLIGVTVGGITLLSCTVLCIVFYVFTRKRYQDLAALSEQIDTILHGNDRIDIDVFREGELSILQSEIQKMTVRLREQADALKKDKTFLSDSLADIAHQLRTPMTSIHMLVSFLKKPDMQPAQRQRFIRDLEILLSRTDWLLSTLLKISKIDAGTAIFQHEPVVLRTLLKKAAEPLEIQLELRNIRLIIGCDETISFIGDLGWTAEAVGNILKNCMEYAGEEGTIEIDCSENAVFTELVIKDSGSGIAPEDLPHIFERFYQGASQKDGSFGVGLALCRMILSAQNATVKATNHPDGGACFTVRFYHQVV
jgi:signal transduction histidine kinase